jgi:hypothetical protein
MGKGFIGFVAAAVLICLLSSCISMEVRPMTSTERGETQVVGTVTASWTVFNFLHIHPTRKNLQNRAVSELQAEARRQGYKDNIDIRNISVIGSFNGLTIMPLPGIFGIIADFQTVTASGDVVSSLTQTKINDAVAKASETMAQTIPRGSVIAVLSVYSSDGSMAEYVIGELEYNLVNSGQFKIVDRRRLDQIRIEQNFQISGEVSDDSAVSIGNILGANIVITGEMTGIGSSQRLSLKALDVKTAQIISMSRVEM